MGITSQTLLCSFCRISQILKLMTNWLPLLVDRPIEKPIDGPPLNITNTLWLSKNFSQKIQNRYLLPVVIVSQSLIPVFLIHRNNFYMGKKASMAYLLKFFIGNGSKPMHEIEDILGSFSDHLILQNLFHFLHFRKAVKQILGLADSI